MSVFKTEFDGKKAFDHVKNLVKIGPRLTGSDGEHKAARYIESQFKSFGLKTTMQKYPALTFSNKKCVLEVLDGGRWRKIDAQPIMLTPSTPEKGLEGEIYFAETGDIEYFSPAMKDKIVFVCGGLWADNRPKFLSLKPKALIIIEGGLGEEPLRMNIGEQNRKDYGILPMARIRHLDGVQIIQKGMRRARLTMINAEKKSYCLNVIGEKRGTDFTDEIVVVCGHYDSSMGITGASDNAGGTAVMMELARIFGKQPTKRTLRFVAFSGEETGLQGSSFYATDLARKAEAEKKRKGFNEKRDKTELQKHRLSFNLDVHGAIIGSNGVSFSGVDDIGASVRLLAKEMSVSCGVSKGPMSSDGTPLAAVGIPAVQFARGGGTSGYLHSTRDEIKYLSAESLEKAGILSELYIRRYIAECGVFPFPREIADDQMKQIKDFFTNTKRPVPGDLKKEEKPEKKARKKRGRK